MHCSLSGTFKQPEIENWTLSLSLWHLQAVTWPSGMLLIVGFGKPFWQQLNCFKNWVANGNGGNINYFLSFSKASLKSVVKHFKFKPGWNTCQNWLQSLWKVWRHVFSNLFFLSLDGQHYSIFTSNVATNIGYRFWC